MLVLFSDMRCVFGIRTNGIDGVRKDVDEENGMQCILRVHTC